MMTQITNQMKETSDELLQIWKKGQVHLNNLWKIWQDEHLLSLKERFKNQIKTTNTLLKLYPKIGQIVHIKENLPRGAWKLGKIIKLIESEDGEIRSTTLLLPTRNIVNKLINLLYPLEIAPVSDGFDSDPSLQEQVQHEENGVNIKQVSERPKRQAARIARDKLKEMCSDEIGIFLCCQECCDDHDFQ